MTGQKGRVGQRSLDKNNIRRESIPSSGILQPLGGGCLAFLTFAAWRLCGKTDFFNPKIAKDEMLGRLLVGFVFAVTVFVHRRHFLTDQIETKALAEKEVVEFFYVFAGFR